MTFEVKPSADNVPITIGDSNQALNKIGIEVTSTEEANIKVTLIVHYGGKETDLLASKDTLAVPSYRMDGMTVPMSAVTYPLPPGGERVWDTGSDAIAISSSQKLTILLEKFVSNTPPGESRIAVLIRTEDREVWSPEERIPEIGIPIAKIPKHSQNPEIQYFTLDPDYILHAGHTQVKVRFYATDYKSEDIALYRNNELVIWKDPYDLFVKARIKFNEEKIKFLDLECGDDIDLRKQVDALLIGSTNNGTSSALSQSNAVSGYFTDYPSITSVYRLEARPEGKLSYIEKRNVQVISPGWNQIALPQGSPVRLFAGRYFSADKDEPRLYGIFLNKGAGFALYSSATGVDDWQLEKGQVPQQMAMSPGVYYKNRLWLIGGSSVDGNKFSNAVSYYGMNKNKTGCEWRTWKFETTGPKPPPRMGHACVVFPGKVEDGNVNEGIWVLGGYQSTSAYSDVWRLIVKENDSGEITNISWDELSQNAWENGRLNHAATSFMNDDGLNEVWIYGGTQKPQSSMVLFDLWKTIDGGKTWTISEEDPAIIPDPGEPLGSSLVAYPQDDAGFDRVFLMGSFREWAEGMTEGKRSSTTRKGNRVSSFMFEWHSPKGQWEARPVLSGWQQFRGENFYMQAVAFNQFLFIWSLQASIDWTLKLNILIP